MSTLVSIRDVHKSFDHMGRKLEVLRGIDLDIDAGRGGRHRRAVGRRQEHAPALHRHARLAHRAARSRWRARTSPTLGARTRKLAALRNRTIGFVFQFHHLLPEFNALENVMMPGLIQGKSRGRDGGARRGAARPRSASPIA